MKITPRQLEVLRIMRDEDEELVYERGVGYLGLSPVAPRTVFALLCLMAIKGDIRSEGVERYRISETGCQILILHKHARITGGQS